MSDYLESVEDESKIRFYANKNYHYALKLGKELHLVYKAICCKTSGFHSESNELILNNLKKHIVYSLLFIQELFSPFLERETLPEGQLVDYLFDGEHSLKMAEVEKFNLNRRKGYKALLKSDCEKLNSIGEKIEFYKSKISETKNAIEIDFIKHGWTSKYLFDKKEISINLLKELLYQHFKNELTTKTKDLSEIEKYKYLQRLLCDISLSKVDDSDYILDGPITEEINTELNHLEKILNINDSASKGDILNDLIDCLIVVQSRKIHLDKESRKNEYLTDLLRTKNYYISDETRSGMSGNNKNAIESGELDIAIRDKDRIGIIHTIIEAFEANSIGIKDNVIKRHVKKLIDRYDSSGNSQNFIIIYSNLENFQKGWDKFKDHIQHVIFNNEINFIDSGSEVSKKFKILTGHHFVSDGKMKINYIFLDVNRDK